MNIKFLQHYISIGGMGFEGLNNHYNELKNCSPKCAKCGNPIINGWHDDEMNKDYCGDRCLILSIEEDIRERQIEIDESLFLTDLVGWYAGEMPTSYTYRKLMYKICEFWNDSAVEAISNFTVEEMFHTVHGSKNWDAIATSRDVNGVIDGNIGIKL